MALGTIIQIAGGVGFFLVMIVQYFATLDGIVYGLGVHTLVGVILSFVLTGLPLVGAIAGLYGATAVWAWEWWQAVLLFFGIPIGAFLLVGGASGIDAIRSRR